jgi:hypothetical protein
MHCPSPQNAGWSSLVARQAHNLKVAGSNPAPATKLNSLKSRGLRQRNRQQKAARIMQQNAAKVTRNAAFLTRVVTRVFGS